MLEKADALAALAERHLEDEGTLAACIVVILAEALEQGTRTALDSMAIQIAVARELEDAENPALVLRGQSLRRRIIELPFVPSDGKLKSDSRRPELRAIHELITLRNDLMHVTEQTHVLERPIEADMDNLGFRVRTADAPVPQNQPDQVRTTDDAVEMDKTQRFDVTIEGPDGILAHQEFVQPTNPWTTVTMTKARLYRDAVGLYVKEIIYPGQTIKPSVIAKLIDKNNV